MSSSEPTIVRKILDGLQAMESLHPDEESLKTTIKEVVKRRGLLEFLLRDSGKVVDGFLNGDVTLEQMAFACQGVWLEQASGVAISESGDLLLKVTEDGMELMGDLADQTPMLHRQALLRQIERWAVFRANGLLEITSPNMSVLDMGSGSAIGSVMMRDLYPHAAITSIDPGHISAKTHSIMEAKDINFKPCLIDELPPEKNYDAILLHFVLEHSRLAAKNILAESIKRLEHGGVISISVPNFDAFHRQIEARLGLNGRDPVTRLSQHDQMSGHQIIFTQENLIRLIGEVQAELGTDLPISSKTILPRPLAFNTLASLKHQSHLFDMERAGHIPGYEERGSVIAITIGKESTPAKTDESGHTRRLFHEILEAFFKYGDNQKYRNVFQF